MQSREWTVSSNSNLFLSPAASENRSCKVAVVDVQPM